MLPVLHFVLILKLQEFFGVAPWHGNCPCSLRAGRPPARGEQVRKRSLPTFAFPACNPASPRGATGLGDASPQGSAARLGWLADARSRCAPANEARCFMHPPTAPATVRSKPCTGGASEDASAD